VVLFPNAKINIGLNVLSRRPDGYHDLETVFYPVRWTDVLEVIPSRNKTSFTLSGIEVPGNPESNLCLKAYYLLNDSFNLPEVDIYLHKIIPMGAGLGGGSSDGAYVIRLLNELYGLGLDEKELSGFALKLGSDCPFFIYNKPVFASGRGEKMFPITLTLKGYYILIIKPPIHVATADAFNMIRPGKPEKSLAELALMPLEKWKHEIINDFEKPVFADHPGIKKIKDSL